MSYKPKFKEKDLKQITRNVLSTEWNKWEINPVNWEWKPKNKNVVVHFPYEDSQHIDKDKTWTMALPIRPFEIGYKPYIREIQDGKKEQE